MKTVFEIRSLVLIVASTAYCVFSVYSQEVKSEKAVESHSADVTQRTPAELFRQIQELAQSQPASQSQAAVEEHLRKLSSKILKLTDQILSQKTDDETAIRAIRMKFEMLDLQIRLGEILARLQAKQFAQKLSADKRPAIARVGKARMIEVRAGKAVLLKTDEKQKLVEDLVSFLKSGEIDKTAVGLAISVTQSLERTGDNKVTVSAYEQSAKLLANAELNGVPAIIENFKGSARRLNLPGKEVRLVGKAFSGEGFDWTSYKGKVVLVDFWATWCPTCVAKMPKFVELYREFHNQGLEIVGVNVDENPLRVSSFLNRTPLPWTQLYGDKNGRPGAANVNADYYGVYALPTVFLVGKDGKVVSIKALDGDLREVIKKQLAKK